MFTRREFCGTLVAAEELSESSFVRADRILILEFHFGPSRDRDATMKKLRTGSVRGFLAYPKDGSSTMSNRYVISSGLTMEK